MEPIFLKILNMSLSAGIITVAVLLIRKLIFTYDMPKYLRCLLWTFVAFRLVCPFTVETSLSLMPKAEIFTPDPLPDLTQIAPPTFENVMDSVISGDISKVAPSDIPLSDLIIKTGSILWLAGLSIMLLYAVFSFFFIKIKMKTAIPTGEKHILICDGDFSPFILGIFAPKIYLPSHLSEESKKFIIAHEKAHLKRFDHLWKPLGFLLLSLHWFNPLIWAAYVLFCRDIEFACDEKVTLDMDKEEKMAYSHVLLSCSVPRKRISACPLAFGEVGIKSRIKSIWKSKKTTAFAIIAFILAVIVICSNFMTNSPDKPSLPAIVSNISNGSDHQKVELDLVGADFSTIYPYIDIKWKNKTEDSVTFGENYTISIFENGKWTPVYDPDTVLAIGYMAPSLLGAKHRYSGFAIEKSGKYRFETDFFFDKKHDEKYTVWCEFEISEDMEHSSSATYVKSAAVFTNPDHKPTSTAGEAFTLSANPFGFFVTKGNLSYDIQEATISDNVKTLLSACYSENSKLSASKLISDNKRIWRGIYTEGKETEHLVFLLEQADGELYLAEGYCLDVTEDILSPENAYIEIIYKLDKQ